MTYDTFSLASAIESNITHEMTNPVIAAYIDDDGDVTFRHESELVPSDCTAAVEFDMEAFGDFSYYEDENGEPDDPPALARAIAQMCTDDPAVWLEWVIA